MVLIVPFSRCFSDVGRAGGKQELSLDDGCLHVDTVIHELVSLVSNAIVEFSQMHSVGFYHEHERWDRDNYLVILWQNIDRGILPRPLPNFLSQKPMISLAVSILSRAIIMARIMASVKMRSKEALIDARLKITTPSCTTTVWLSVEMGGKRFWPESPQ